MEVCKNCGSRLVEKATKKTAEQLKKPYYYSAYYFCLHCKKLYHDEKFKVYNNQTSLPSSLFDESPVSASHEVSIWTDGACVHNGTPRARAAWAFVSGKTERAGLVDGKQTNNVAEALAIYYALVWAAEKKYRKVKLHTDSQISIHGVSKPAHLVKANKEIFEDIQRVVRGCHLQVEFVKVLGHSGEPENERVDKLANNLASTG